MLSELLDCVHPDVRLSSEPLPDQENARFLWEEAASYLQPIEVAEFEEFETRALADKVDPPYWLPQGEVRNDVRNLLERNRRALETANLGLSLGRFRFRRPRGPEHFAEDTSLDQFFRHITRIRSFQVRLHVSCGEFNAATRELSRALRMAEMALQGEGLIVSYLLTSACRARCLDEIRGFARLPGAPISAIEHLRAAVQRESIQAESLAQSLRMEFHGYFLAQFVQLCECKSVTELVDAALKGFYSEYIALSSDPPAPHPDGRSEWRRQRLVELLAAHPQPFDPAETISSFTSRVVDIISQVRSAWNAEMPRSAPSELPDDSWPQQLRPSFDYDCLGPGPEAAIAVAAAVDFFRAEMNDGAMAEQIARHMQLPDEATFATARARLRQFSNPVGLIIVESESANLPAYVAHAFRMRAEYAATQAVLAIRLYFAQRSRLPDRLEDLVLADAPLDPFSGKPLHYARERGILWSVGDDGIDQGGDPEHDLVWTVATG